jgi:hypothetical protein
MGVNCNRSKEPVTLHIHLLNHHLKVEQLRRQQGGWAEGEEAGCRGQDLRKGLVTARLLAALATKAS